MPAVGGRKTPHPEALWSQVKELVLQGLPYKEIAERTGLKPEVIMTTASLKKWTVQKAEIKAKADLETLRPKLHQHLQALTKQTRVPRTHSAKQLKPVADLVLALANGAKLVEGWREEEQNTLVNVLQISNSVTTNAPKAIIDSIDVDVVQSDPDYSI